MLSLIDRVVSVVDALDGREGLVKVGLAEVTAAGAVPVDLLHCRGAVEAHSVGCKSDDGAIFGVQSVEVEMSVAAVGVVGGVERGEFGEGRAGDVG